MKKIIEAIRGMFPGRHRGKDVALVLGGGGARGIAHIGAIEVLEEHGYHITSVAGTSMGALVGGLYAAGQLDELKCRILNLDRKQMVSIMDVSLGLDHIASGRHLMQLINSLIGDVMIEDLPIPFCCCATDVVGGREHVFRSGRLSTAIRSSISIPCVFKPVSEDGHIYVDGSVHNTLPLDRVVRHEGDLLVAVNVSAPDDEPFTAYLKQPVEAPSEAERTLRSRLSFLKTDFSENYMNMALRIARLSIQNNTRMALRLTPPDICVELPMNSFGLFDFDKGEEIIRRGREEMERELESLCNS